ncbi:NADPH-ferrihemoprotein reductase [Exophiala aquamarina CBS 119918]|uniref:NADPH-ferrihemoprotein reductase n=1 Tax=Exophiala aquamarina CBS 119918 TaxID=1182545 RepID=A0A072P634_9EURO|nr:NADPH-ferrihemoprotein reductase [Exophiala aquamarina CBS 119918]KEF55579.1 NADPH-ferrihemoprotein reductase [Exophiala aquamarina CBS 119918]
MAPSLTMQFHFVKIVTFWLFSISESDLTTSDPKVFLGEANKLQLQGRFQQPFNSHNPFHAQMVASRQIFKTKDRNCIHMEFDLTGSGLEYVTGDHVSIMPINSGIEVDRFLSVFGLTFKRDTVIDIETIEKTAKLPFPFPTTYDTAVQYKREIGAPVSRQFVQQLTQYTPPSDAKAELEKLGAD